jgi:hypothetical protein
MKTVRAIVVGAGWCLDAKIDGDKTVGELKAKLRDSRKHYMCMIDDMNLYLAKRDGKWLQWSHREVQRLLKGEVPGSVTALMPEDNKLAPECSLRDFGFTDLEHRKLEEIAVLLEYPECITRRYRRELGHSPGTTLVLLCSSTACDGVR